MPAPRSVVANRKTSVVSARQLPVDGERPQGRLLGSAPRPELQGQTPPRPVLVARPALKGRGRSLPAPRSVVANRKTSVVSARRLPVDGERPQGRSLGSAPRPELQGQTPPRPVLVARPALKGRGCSLPASRSVFANRKTSVVSGAGCLLTAKDLRASMRPELQGQTPSCPELQGPTPRV